MPTRYRKKRYRRRRKKGKKLVLLKSPVPKTMFTKMRYHTTFNLDPGTGILAYKIIKANGMYDPEVSAGGHQPRGFDQLMALYDHFVVLGSKITASFASANTSYSTINLVALRDTSTPSAAVNDYMEGGYVSSKIAEVRGGGGINIIKKTFNNKFLGRSKALSDPDLKGSASADPTEGAYFHIITSAMDSSVDPVVTNVSIVIDYIVALIEPKNPAQS